MLERKDSRPKELKLGDSGFRPDPNDELKFEESDNDIAPPVKPKVEEKKQPPTKPTINKPVEIIKDTKPVLKQQIEKPVETVKPG